MASPEAVAAEEHLIAVVMANSQQRYQDIHAVFAEDSQTFCGENCRIYVQAPNADVMSLRNSVRKAIALGADLIITYGPSATLAAKAESPSIPTLFADVYDPVGLGLVSDKTLTGRNMTGIRGDAPVQTLLKYFVETTKAQKLAVLYDLNSPEGTLQKKVLEASGKKRGVTVVPLVVENQKDHISPLEGVPGDAEGLFLASSEHEGNYLEQVLKFASDRKLPVISQRSGAAEAGVFMVLETSAVEQGKKLAEMAGQILSGKKTDEIRMHIPHDVAFVVNLKVAKEYGIQVPFQTLSVASRVVQ
jgi:putative ABC transport system substrate-binding protein